MEIEWSVLANRQLLDIVQYVADNFGQKTATKTLKRIQEKVGRLLLFRKVALTTSICLLMFM